ncbi:hypothetical protein DPMN_104688 [Dreissena polymorpha]|uniref:Uncharacterized protein n=1 Tax=Dreissena polymorpha TaxID=45954 RepID=A0A9D4H887_DREPO|nr:hypothetical protein DPMN_104688 [Dreissena polymorpha]
MINSPPPGSKVVQPTGTISKQIKDIIGMNLLTKFHEDRTINVASRVLTRFTIAIKIKIHCPLAAMFFKQPETFSNSSKISFVQIH